MASALAATIVLTACFYALSPRFETTKQVSWILTTLSSLVLTIAGLPFLFDVHPHPIPVARFYQSYLACDLVLGVIHYRSHLTLLTSWLHHIVLAFVVEIAIRKSWVNSLCLCAAMEAPTLLRGLSTLYPSTRSTRLFLTVLFTTRILFPLLVAYSFLQEHNRTRLFAGSYLPAAALVLLVPFHILWFLYRLRWVHNQAFKGRAPITPKETIINLQIFGEKNPAPLPKRRPSEPSRPRPSALSTPAPFSCMAESPSEPIYSINVGTPSVNGTLHLTARLYAAIPPRETVYEVVGLGKPRERSPLRERRRRESASIRTRRDGLVNVQ